jgi:RNA polymerase sigma factor (sigma-70 family)
VLEPIKPQECESGALPDEAYYRGCFERAMATPHCDKSRDKVDELIRDRLKRLGLRPDSEAMDAVSVAVWHKLWRKRENNSLDGASFHVVLGRACRDENAEHWREIAKENLARDAEVCDIEELPACPPKDQSPSVAHDDIATAIASLPQDQRSAIHCAYLDWDPVKERCGLSLSAAAKQLGTSIQAIRTTLKKAERAIHERLGEAWMAHYGVEVPGDESAD